MFPFLAPIHTRGYRYQQNVQVEGHLRMEYFYDIPLINHGDIHSSLVSLEDDGSISENSSLSESDERQKLKSTPYQNSQPTSARNVKSSTVTPTPSDIPPPLSRHKNKGLETSTAMLELFGGSSAFGPSSVFERIPSVPNKNFHRKNVLAKESHQDAEIFSRIRPTVKAPFFSEVGDHRMFHEKTNKRVSEKIHNQFAQPGPEWLEGSEQIDVINLNMECSSVEKVLGKSLYEKATPDFESDWDEAKEDVLTLFNSTNVPKDVVAGLPGPDLGEDEEDVEERTSIVPSRRNSCEKAETDNERDGQDVEDMVPRMEPESSLAVGSDMALVIKGAQIVNDDSIFVADVLIQDGIIRNVGLSLDVPSGVEVIDACGKMLLPAGIDVYTQFSDPESVDDISTGCKAALAGGTATVIEVVSPKSDESLLSAFTRIRKSLDNAPCNVALSVVIRKWSDATRKEMEKVVLEGVNNFIVDVEKDDVLYQILEHCRSLGVHVRVLPENRTIIPFLESRMLELGISGPEGFLQSRPEELESERVTSICFLSQLTNCPVSILSVSSAESVISLERARLSGALVHSEISVAAIASDGSHYFNKCLKHASAHLTENPLRTEGSSKLIGALTSQPLAVSSSGHKAITSSSRLSAKDFTTMIKGVTGVEERMSIIWEKVVCPGRMDPMRFVAVTSSNAAKMFNLYPKKGRIAVGADADLVLWDTSIRRKLTVAEGQSAVDVSLYEGMMIHAEAVVTILSGHIVWRDGRLKNTKGGYVPLISNNPYLFSVVQQRDKIVLAEKVERDNMQSANGVGPKCSAGESHFERPTTGRKTHLESNIEFGSGDMRPSTTRVRNPPGGKTTGFW